MAKIVRPLTNTEVDKAKAKEKDYRLTDGKGLYLLVKSNKSKLWRFNYYRPFAKNRNDLSLGRYPDVSLAQARELRQEYLSLLAQNIDPQVHRQKIERETLEKQDNTFFKIACKWKVKKQTEVAQSTLIKNWQRLENHIFPKMGHYPVSEITPQLVIKTIEPLNKQGKTDTVKKLSRLVNEVIDFAVNSGILEFNKCTKVGSTFMRKSVINNPSIRPEDLPEFLTALRNSNISLVTKKLIQWQLLTMVRPKEAANAEWIEIDFESKLWNIPAQKMKGGKKAHTVPLSTQALAILEVMKELTGNSKYIFASFRNPTKPLNPQTANRSIGLIGYSGKLTSHGLRSIASTYLNEQFLEQYDAIEACLSHGIKNAVRKAYNRSNYLEQRKNLMQKWGDYVENCSKGL
ncbi:MULTISPECIES: integrase arm-type DNA-binding domain-containing protein [Pasteurellaceae]|uniref:Integrase arm-type DNA-binding domain-containing protein n=1 Tax=Pasteurella atlantica TaxID=2827233 RepID=A0AAW8CPH9_9PAST|nr:integrase arm-type DNA-binding domain-containing protein [Pasteurella atlantica]MBR0574158.1 integrase arm-type DNA-binding domain-containing protein [Pasteurella atlantica]MDP8039267.1 integrase arm-type DNA-binding domain-containing protein [Pasteurella atlantica]MDP8041359.1 integrase arm-type DNA-binding domain-containing protein [Pasteurella atlantica]MDP8043495.1 integrase arm-type DNA-binding domain-containing protein [Pasteurella atlantica]MDP8045587.1 integrase arm-type DNA-binding